MRVVSRSSLGLALVLGMWSQAATAAPPPAFKTCAACHLPSAQGVPGAFPPLAGRIAPIAATPAGRRYVVEVLAYGLSGEIAVANTTYRGFMPRQSALSASDAAAILNYLGAETGDPKAAAKFKPFTAAEIEQLRKAAPGRTGADVAKSRAAAVPDAGRR